MSLSSDLGSSTVSVPSDLGSSNVHLVFLLGSINISLGNGKRLSDLIKNSSKYTENSFITNT